MNVVRRLKESSTALKEPPSPTPSARTADSADTTSEAGPSGVNGSIWYRVSRRDYPKSKHGYESYRFSLQKEGQLRLAECVVFWPFVSPEDREMVDGKWDDMDGVFAIASCGRVMVGRISDAGYQDLWTYETENEDHYHVAWSYDPITLRPILASGGKSGIIWLFDHLLGGPTRILKGHGHEILSIVFHPLHPHILASSSNDRTIRIWNIYGTDVMREEGDREPLSENYPQGDADEGNYLLAILAGDKAGHKAGVTALAFHPYHNAIASGGYDHQVKVWRLPPIPSPDPAMPPTRRGYRPLLINMPLFSTDRLHRYPIDSIEWLNKDMLLTRAGEEMTGWKWLGYKDHFKPDQPEPFWPQARPSDMVSSHSFSITLDLVEDQADWYWRMGTHLAFNPTEIEADFATVKVVVDNLIAYPVEGSPPRLHLLNPFTWEPGPDPIPPAEGYRRSLTPDENGEGWAPSQVGASEVMAIKVDPDETEAGYDIGHSNGDGRAIEHDDSTGGQGTSRDTVSRKRKMDDRSSIDSDDHDDDIIILETPSSMTAPTPELPLKPNMKNSTETQDPWALVVRKNDLEKAISMSRLGANAKQELKKSKKLLRCVAISPRGAKWIVAVGQGEAVAIWRLKDKTMQEKSEDAGLL